jgi:hypothetical protein
LTEGERGAKDKGDELGKEVYGTVQGKLGLSISFPGLEGRKTQGKAQGHLKSLRLVIQVMGT